MITGATGLHKSAIFMDPGDTSAPVFHHHDNPILEVVMILGPEMIRVRQENVHATGPSMLVSKYERSVLHMMVVGYSDSAIAKHHYVAKRTLERHLADLMNRVGARSRVGLGAIAVRERWIDPNTLQ